MVSTAVFDPDTRRIAPASDDGSVRIWRVGTGDDLVVTSEHQGPVRVVAFTDDGRQTISVSSDGSIKICDSFGRDRAMALKSHESMVISAQFSLGHKYIASPSSDYYHTSIPHQEVQRPDPWLYSFRTHSN